jgi:translation initiation factor 2 subunit 1
MLNIKHGFPNEGDIVFCTVTNVQYNSVFVKLDEYERKSGMIHISEISPGRIRNIRDYVKEGKVIICKVLRINKERGHIDLSLRRVNESQRREKVEERKQQVIAENIIKSYALLHDKKLRDVYTPISKKILEHYSSVYGAFEDVVESGLSLASLGVEESTAKELETIIRDRIKPKQVTIEGELVVESYADNGVEIVNSFMSKIIALDEKLSVTFLGAGRFKIIVIAHDYKEAEDVMSRFTKLVEEFNDGDITKAKFERL